METNPSKPLGHKETFSVDKTARKEGDFYFYPVARLGDRPLTFTAKVSKSQGAAAKPTDVEAIERWFQLHSGRLPQDDETIEPDFAEVKIE